MKSSCARCTPSIPIMPKTQASIMFIGLSSKPDADMLCPSTNTGRLIASIEEYLGKQLRIYRTNAVKCAPLDGNGKLRYPTDKEMKKCLPSLLGEIKGVSPKVIVPLGAQVARFLLANLGSDNKFNGFSSTFDYDTYSMSPWEAMPIHHPSYIWVYKRKQIDKYIMKVGDKLFAMAAS